MPGRTSAVDGPASAAPAHFHPLADIAVGILAFCTYAGTLGYGFVWDDPISLQRWLPALQSVAAIFFPPANIPQFPPDYYRPLQLVSYHFDRLVGGGAPWPFHLTSVLLHSLASVLVLRVGLRLFAAHSAGWLAALGAALLFAAHPIHSESVAWMAARPDVMVACAGLAAVLVYQRQDWRPLSRSVSAALCMLAGLLCKETAAALLLLLPASNFLLPQNAVATPAGSRAQRRRAASPAVTASANAQLYLPLLAALLVYIVLRTLGLSRMPATAVVAPEHPLLAVVGAFGLYLRLLVAPYPQSAYISDLPIGGGGLLASLAAIGVFAAIGILAWRRTDRPTLFAWLWLGSTLAPSLAVLFKIPTAPVAERYLYLPSIGLCWLAASAAAAFIERDDSASRRRACAASFAGLTALGIALTVGRNPIWRDNLSLWGDTARKNSTDGLPLRSLAAARLERGDSAAAEDLFQQALQRRNNSLGQFTINNNLGTIAMNREDLSGAENYFRRALAFNPSADVLYNLGLIALRRGTNPQLTSDAAARQAQLREARSQFDRALQVSPHDPEIHIALAQTTQALGDAVTARTHYQTALQLGLPAPTATAVRKLLEELR